MGIWTFITASKLLWPWKGAPCGMTITVIRTSSICSDTALLQEQIFPFLLTSIQCSPSFIAQDSVHLITSNWILTKPKISVLPSALFITYCPSLRTEPPEFKGSANNHEINFCNLKECQNIIIPTVLNWITKEQDQCSLALYSRFKITGTKICKGFVLYFTVQLFNSLFQVAGPGTRYRSPELSILCLQVILGFVQAVLCPCPAPESPK